jgi:hypothetical protein
MSGTEKWNRHKKKNTDNIRRRTSSVETVQSDVTRNETMTNTSATTTTTTSGADTLSPKEASQSQTATQLLLLQEDVWPLIMSYCGPQEMNQLADMHGFFRSIANKESTWRVLCEQLYKVRLVEIVGSFCALVIMDGFFLSNSF